MVGVECGTLSSYSISILFFFWFLFVSLSSFLFFALCLFSSNHQPAKLTCYATGAMMRLLYLSLPFLSVQRRKSAVERLNETKKHYVKSEQVRGGRQLLNQSSSPDLCPGQQQMHQNPIDKLAHQHLQTQSSNQVASILLANHSFSPNDTIALPTCSSSFPQTVSPQSQLSLTSLSKRRTLSGSTSSGGRCGVGSGSGNGRPSVDIIQPLTIGSSSGNTGAVHNNNLEEQLRQLITSSRDSLNAIPSSCRYNGLRTSKSTNQLRYASPVPLDTQQSNCLRDRSKQSSYANSQMERKAAVTTNGRFCSNSLGTTLRNNNIASHTQSKVTCEPINSSTTKSEFNGNPSNSTFTSGIKFAELAVVVGGTAGECTSSSTCRPSSISRSKSDIGHRQATVKASKNRDELERFFASFGLDSSTWAALTNNSNSFTSTPTRFFTSNDSIDSGMRRLSMMSKSSDDGSVDFGIGRHGSKAKRSQTESSDNQASSASPDCSQSLSPKKRQLTLSSSLSSHGFLRETSIVEKNARVIKWLYNCKKATAEGDNSSAALTDGLLPTNWWPAVTPTLTGLSMSIWDCI